MDDKELIGKQLQSAFPSHGTMGEVVETGMTLRDYFAAKALEGMLACSRDPIMDAHQLRAHIDANAVARQAYHFADAMLAAREAT